MGEQYREKEEGSVEESALYPSYNPKIVLAGLPLSALPARIDSCEQGVSGRLVPDPQICLREKTFEDISS